MAPSSEDAHDQLIRDQKHLRALARGLLRDPQAADDVVQDAWLVAAKPRRLGRPRAWLRTVTRNLALRSIRSSQRRRSREHRAARKDRLPSTVDRVEAIELRRRLLDAVESLHEPYRSTIVWRYFDELSPSAIAREHDIPVKTVKTRLARGLKQLRYRLDRSHGDRRAWALPFAAIAWPDGAAAASTASLLGIGGVAMAAKTVVVAAVILIALGVWLVVESPWDTSEPVSTQSSTSSSDPDPASGPTLRGADGAGDLHAEPATPTEKDPADEAAASGTAFVSGVVLLANESREPVGGLVLLLRRVEKHATERRTTFIKTGADGRFRTPAAMAIGRVRIQVRSTVEPYRKPLVLADLELGTSDSENLELLFPWYGRATVVVLDENKVPIPRAKVALFGVDNWRLPRAEGGTATDEGGAVRFEHLPLDRSLVAVARAAGFGPVRSKEFLVGDAQDVRLVLHAGKGARVRGRVERADGSRAAKVLVSVAYSSRQGDVPPVAPRFVHTDENGLFEMHDVAAGSYQFRADLDGTTAATDGQLQVAAGDTVDVVLRPAADLAITGIVVDEDGKPWTAARRSDSSKDPRGPLSVSVGARQYRAGMAFPHMVMLDERGRFEVKVPVGTSYRLKAYASHLAFASSESAEVDPGASDVRLVWQQPPAQLSVQVLSERTGEALAGAEVVFSKHVGEQSTTTRSHCDAKGECRGPRVGAGTFQVCVFAKGYCYDEVSIELDTKAKGDQRRVLRLGPGRTVRGRVEDREGRPLAERRVGILLPCGFGCFEDSFVATDERGAFVIEGLRPRGGRVAVFGSIGDTRWQADASGDDVVIVVKSP